MADRNEDVLREQLEDLELQENELQLQQNRLELKKRRIFLQRQLAKSSREQGTHGKPIKIEDDG